MSRHGKAMYTGMLFFVYLVVYVTIQYFVQKTQVDYWLEIDGAIPFMPEVVWIYHTLPVLIAMVMVVYIQRRVLFMQTFWACIIAGVVMSIFHIAAPAIYPRVPFEVTNVHETLVEFTRVIDGASNTFPSGHVAFSWLMFLAASKTEYAKENAFIVSFFLLWAIGISLSTLVIKQHFFADVISGILTAVLSFYAARLFIGHHKERTPSY